MFHKYQIVCYNCVLKLYTSIYQYMKKKNVCLYLISESKVMPFFCFVLTFWTNMLWQMFDNACKTYFWLIFIIFIMLNMYLCSARRRNLEADRRNWKYMISRPSQISFLIWRSCGNQLLLQMSWSQIVNLWKS